MLFAFNSQFYDLIMQPFLKLDEYNKKDEQKNRWSSSNSIVVWFQTTLMLSILTKKTDHEIAIWEGKAI